jgi:hypothetical protein
VLLGANLTSQVMKEVLERPFLDWGPLPEPSFPSGHAMVPLSLACAALLVLRPVDRAFAASLAIPAAIAAGVGVVAFAWHRPSDSIASALVAGAWTAAAAAALAYRGRAAVAPSEGGWTRARSAAATAAVALAAIAGIWFAFEMLTAPVYDGIRFGPYNLVGAILIGLTTAAMLGALAYLMRDLDFGAPAQPSRAPAGGRPRSAAGRAGVTIRARG